MLPQAKGKEIVKHPKRVASAAATREAEHDAAELRRGKADAEAALQVSLLCSALALAADSDTRAACRNDAKSSCSSCTVRRSFKRVAQTRAARASRVLLGCKACILYGGDTEVERPARHAAEHCFSRVTRILGQHLYTSRLHWEALRRPRVHSTSDIHYLREFEHRSQAHSCLR